MILTVVFAVYGGQWRDCAFKDFLNGGKREVEAVLPFDLLLDAADSQPALLKEFKDPGPLLLLDFYSW